MSKYFNPFKPGYPVYRGLFVGRKAEIKKIDDALNQLKEENPLNLLFTGERGIGKTSLLLLAKQLAVGELTFDKTHNFLTVTINLNDKTNLADFIIRFQSQLKRELHKLDRTRKVLDDIWDFTQRLEVKGLKIKKDEKLSVQQILDDFTYSLIDSIEKIRNDEKINKDGIVLIIDEADTACKDLSLGSFLKQLTESLTFEGCHNLMIIMSGLPTTAEVLRKSHESSPRLFEEKELGPLDREQSLTVLNKGLEVIEEKSGVKVTFTKDAKDLFVGYSEGYPHYIQQLAHSIISDIEDPNVEVEQVSDSMNRQGGALDLIGKRYYVDLFYEKIKVDSYRQILSIMAENWNEWMKKSDIRSKFTGSGTDLNNGIKALRDRNIILSKRGVKGVYRLQWLSFAFWIKIHHHFEKNN